MSILTKPRESSSVREFADIPAMLKAMQPSYPVYCLRPDLIEKAAKRFLDLFPGRVLYAVKCNPHPEILRALYAAGIRHFDTASLPEIAQVRELFHEVSCYFMHPVKARPVINTSAKVYNINTFVADHPKEIEKIISETGGGEGITIIIRIVTPPVEGAFYHLAGKFGADIEQAAQMLKDVHNQGCQTGIAFHVGSQCLVPDAYRAAMRLVGQVLERAGVEIQYLDVGGGFPAGYLGQNMPPLESFIDEIEQGLRELKLRRDCTIMCEPGRALVADAVSLITQIQLRKDDRLYINDGIYGALSETVDAGVRYPSKLWRLNGAASQEKAPFIINGPTCDSLDVLPSPFDLPIDATEGDWIEIDRVGAYSNALATHFNGFHPDTLVRIKDSPLSSHD